jgi:hypothetical protein
LKRVFELDGLRGHDSALACLAEAVEEFAVAPIVGAPFRVPERLELLAREEVAVAGDDLRLLGNLLLPDAHRPRLLRPLEQEPLQPGLELGRRPDGRDGHSRAALPLGLRAGGPIHRVRRLSLARTW